MKKKNRGLRWMVIFLTVALVTLGAVSVTAFAEQSSKDKKTDSAAEEKDAEKENRSNEETVYVLTDADGTEHQRIVSEKGELHYEGYQDCKLPVTVKIQYTLDGKKMQPEKLAGRDGHLVMTLTYENHTAAVPFLAVSGMVLDHEHFSDIKVEGGRMTDDGDRTIVLGLGMPGVAENLGSAASKLDLPEKVTVSADVKDLQMETVYTFATSQVFSELELSGSMDISELTGQMYQLTEGVDQLLTGTGQLDDGAVKLTEGAEKLMEGAYALRDGAGQLHKGTQELKNGVGQLTKGTQELKTGAEELQGGSAQLKTGADQLSAGLDQLTQSSPAINAGAKQMVDAVFASASQSLQAAGINVTLTADNYAAVLEQAAAGGSAQAAAVKQQLDNVLTFYNGVLTYTAGVDNAAAGSKVFSGGIDAVAAGAEKLAGGAEALEKGQKQLSGGISKVDAGAEKLYGGTRNLADKEKELTAGIQQLGKGAEELHKGVRLMSGELADKLDQLSAGELTDLIDGLSKMADAAKKYDSFGGKGSYESVKFIFKTDGISSK